MDIKRITFTTLCCALSGLLFLYLIKWDWSFFIIPTLMALSVSLTNYDLISIRKKWFGILLHLSLSIILFFVTIFVTFTLSAKIDGYIIFYIGCAFGAILFALLTNIILPLQHFWSSLLIITGLSLICFPIATYIHETSWNIAPILKGRENIAIVWMTFVGLGISIGIHYRNS
ncbi:hypothetical protein H8B06_12030 [Sphingobacterium sp. DN00404]|uniref:Uncharacterized protein n=1 Tax=Sphingobacterium micropteri TaxID=2763501 RepID=A0ABR7YQF2_9SPHI|nr:hypothetical protein [Sphingobacterium micropteri]MBD1433559.1 hypothetical protein [Sphingobacterium micropteri]